MKPLAAFGSSLIGGKFKQIKGPPDAKKISGKTESLQRECTYSTSLRLQPAGLLPSFTSFAYNPSLKMYDGNPK
jgi:hypothetical protein